MKSENPRLTPFIGNNPLCESEHDGEPTYKESFSGTDYLEPVSKQQAYLHDYAMQVQQVINQEYESKETAGKDFLAVALENCQKFNEEFEGTFDKL